MKHPEKDVLRYARGETVSDPQSLVAHLDDCEHCRGTVRFVQNLAEAMRGKGPSKSERPSIDSVLNSAGLDSEQVAGIFERDFLPAEIEWALDGNPAIHECAVVPCADEGERQKLVGFLVKKRGATLGNLRDYLKRNLDVRHDALISFVPLANLPRTANREIDRAALKRISPLGVARSASERIPTELRTSTQQTPAYSIVIPAYNEEKRIGALLQDLLGYVNLCGWDAEVILVNDGSLDNTAVVVRETAAKNPALSLIDNPRNRGKGYTIHQGMVHARGKIRLFIDAETRSIDEVGKLLATIACGAEIAIGVPEPAELQPQLLSPIRKAVRFIVDPLLYSTLGLKFSEIPCAAFTQEAAQALFRVQRIERWGFDPELFYLAKKLGLRVVVVPVAVTQHPSIGRMQLFLDVLRIRWNGLSGKYPLQIKRPSTVLDGSC